MPILQPFTPEDFPALWEFFREQNENDDIQIHWHWGRFEWMYAHPEMDRDSLSAIGLWREGQRVVAAAVYDQYFGEAFCGTLPEFEDLYPEVLAYARERLSDEGGLGIAICDDAAEERAEAEKQGFRQADQTETLMCHCLTNLEYHLPAGIRLESFHPEQEPERFQWLLWRGFDHGLDYDEFRAEEEIKPQHRPHLNPALSIAAVNERGESAAYACVWYVPGTNYGYLEPVCVDPNFRSQGLGKAVVYEALQRAAHLGAKRVYVISDMDFYKKLGFREKRHYTFFWK